MKQISHNSLLKCSQCHHRIPKESEYYMVGYFGWQYRHPARICRNCVYKIYKEFYNY